MNRGYGPHRPEDTPASIEVLEPFTKWPQLVEVPYPAALAEQRAQVNNRAWRAGGTAPCP